MQIKANATTENKNLLRQAFSDIMEVALVPLVQVQSEDILGHSSMIWSVFLSLFDARAFHLRSWHCHAQPFCVTNCPLLPDKRCVTAKGRLS